MLDLSGNTIFGMKHRELCKELGAALRSNTHLREVHLKKCEVDKVDVVEIMTGLASNKSLIVLNLAQNKIDNAGATELANLLRLNSTLRELNLFDQTTKALGDACLTAFVQMFDYNVSLTHINWRLDSRKSFALNKLLVRNNTIRKNLEEKRDVASLIPAHCNIPAILKLRVATAPLPSSDGADSSSGGNVSRGGLARAATLPLLDDDVEQHALKRATSEPSLEGLSAGADGGDGIHLRTPGAAMLLAPVPSAKPTLRPVSLEELAQGFSPSSPVETVVAAPAAMPPSTPTTPSPSHPPNFPIPALDHAPEGVLTGWGTEVVSFSLSCSRGRLMVSKGRTPRRQRAPPLHQGRLTSRAGFAKARS